MKYAYLIIANRNHHQLQQLLTMLDDSRNDIYLMIDKKTKDFPRNFVTHYSELNYVKPINIYWGNYSQIQAELNLFKAAASKHYMYYHLLSGLDMPLVNQDKIHAFFDNHPHKEFIDLFKISSKAPFYLNTRLKPHILRNHLLSNNLFIRILMDIYWEILKLIPQNSILKDDISFGSNWVTIDDDLTHYILKNEEWIRDHFYKGALVDELFIPILINKNRKFVRKLYHSSIKSNLRYIRFSKNNAHPNVWTNNDLPELKKAVNHGYLFARKFDSRIDSLIIKEICEMISQ